MTQSFGAPGSVLLFGWNLFKMSFMFYLRLWDWAANGLDLMAHTFSGGTGRASCRVVITRISWETDTTHLPSPVSFSNMRIFPPYFAQILFGPD